jgi:hypothetical protein
MVAEPISEWGRLRFSQFLQCSDFLDNPTLEKKKVVAQHILPWEHVLSLVVGSENCDRGGDLAEVADQGLLEKDSTLIPSLQHLWPLTITLGFLQCH